MATDSRARSFGLALGLVAMAFAAVRFACLFNDLWLDEIWSLSLVGKLTSATQILTQVTVDNNHPLNSLFLYLLGPGHSDWTYRLFSWITGSLAVVVAGIIAKRRYRGALLAAVLFGGSYLLIHYSSEARGYAPALFFSLVAWFALVSGSDSPWSPLAVLYWACCGLAVLSHLTAAPVFAAGIVYSLIWASSQWSGWRDRIQYLVTWHGLPLVFLVTYYVTFARRLVTGGSPAASLIHALGEASAFALGFPAGLGTVVALPVFVVLVLVGIVLLWRSGGRALAGFHVVLPIAAIVPALVRGDLAEPSPRYFLIAAAFSLFPIVVVLEWLCTRVPRGRWIVAALMILFLGGSTIHTIRLIRFGRGEYRAAIRYVADNTPTPAIGIASNQDFRNFGTISHFEGTLGPGRSFHYYPDKQSDADGPQWIFAAFIEPGDVAPDQLADSLHRDYRLVRVFPHSALSGWDWYVYRNVALLPEE